MSRFLANSPVVAYASMVLSTHGEESDFEFLRRWCSKVPTDIEILADEFHPSVLERPFWNDLLNEIEREAITTLIVPSLFHIAGDDFIALSKFLTFLKVHHVTLKSIVELIDSRRDSQTEIILRLIQDTQKSNSVRGA
jgi:hypothetical protein